MSRNLDDLKMLFHKYRFRYGPDDAMVLQVKQALETRETLESMHPWWFTSSYRERPSGSGTERGRNTMTGASSGNAD
jgi:hypothetical protein